jgi:uncharacterized protein YjiS (DUF1127 family)
MNRFWAALARTWTLHTTRKELHALSDHMLRDIGLRRDQLSSDFLKKDAPVFRGVAGSAVLSAVARVQYSGKPRD